MRRRAEQLDLLEAPAERPFYFVVCDPETGEPLLAVEVEDGDWCAAEKWCYLAASEHHKTCHLVSTRTAYELFHCLTGQHESMKKGTAR